MSAKIYYEIQSLHLYPIKSTRGISQKELILESKGLVRDREWMVVDSSGNFLTQRTLGKMAQIACQMVADGIDVAFGGQTFQVRTPATLAYGSDLAVKVWKSEVLATEVPEAELHQALSVFLGRECRLVHFGEKAERQVMKAGVNYHASVRFADSSTILAVNTASLVDFNQKLSEPITMDRFRANVVFQPVDEAGGVTETKATRAWHEDSWKMLHGEQVDLEVVYPCARCPVINLDPLTGQTVSKEPLLKLSEFRRSDAGVLFGVNIVPRWRQGQQGMDLRLQVGDRFLAVSN